MPSEKRQVGILSDGSLDWSKGVDSLKDPLLTSRLNPNGLERDELSWLIGGTVRGGSISPRSGWNFLGVVSDGASLFQGAQMYQPIDGSTPYLLDSIGGHIYQRYADAAANGVDVGAGVQDNYAPGTPTAISSQVTVWLQWTYLTPTDVVVGDTIASANLNVNGLGAAFTSFVIPAAGASVPVLLASDAKAGSGVTPGGSIQLWLTAGPHGGTNVATIWTVLAVQPSGVRNTAAIVAPNIVNPAQVPYAYFCQAEQFMVIQAGDYAQLEQQGQGIATGYWAVQLECVSLTYPNVQPGDTISTAVLEVNGFNCGFNPFVIPQLNGSVFVTCLVGQTPTQNGALLTAGQQVQFWFTTAPHGGNNVSTTWEVLNVEFVEPNTYPTLPLFWDGTTLSRSSGITNLGVAPGTPGVNQLPPGGPMLYYMGRIWFAAGRNYSAGDIAQGGSGTMAYNFVDSILNVTENPLVVGGDGFTVPSNTGNITALKYNGQLDAALGQGLLYVFTQGAIYSLTVPVTRAAWIASNSSNPPFQAVVQLTNGSINDRSITAYNGDLFYKSSPPGIWSLINAIRYFDTWGNTAISNNEQRILQAENMALLNYSSSVIFDDRLLNTALPVQTPQGVIHQAILPLDFTPLESFEKKLPPTWEGHWEGLQILQLVQGQYPQGPRTFAYVVNSTNGQIELWEITLNGASDNNAAGESRISMVAEFPSFDFQEVLDPKELLTMELWLDSIAGEVIFSLDWRPDSDPCWHPWFTWKLCSARTSAEVPGLPAYPLVSFRTSYRSTITVPHPPTQCQSVTGRPGYIGYSFQPRLTIKGACRIRGMFMHAQKREDKLYQNMVEAYDPTQGKLT